MNDEELYVHRDSVTSYADINRELARYFSCTGVQNQCLPDSVLQQSNDCMRQLKFVLFACLYCHSWIVWKDDCPVWVLDNPLLSFHFFTFPPSTLSFSIFSFFLFTFLTCFINFLCLTIPSHSTRIVS